VAYKKELRAIMAGEIYSIATKRYDLIIIMPVYNEEACIEHVVTSWIIALEHLNINFLLIVLNDGSRDNTELRLRNFSKDTRIRVINKKNSGHGSTILIGYHLAVIEAEWVFQVDSDDELKPDSFGEIWQRRNSFDALFGFRVGRSQSVSRKIISFISRFVVSITFGSDIQDVNVPYRLIRSDVLQTILTTIPSDCFAPNILISGALVVGKLRIYNHPVNHVNRKTGTVSIVSWKLWKAALLSFNQTLAFRMQLLVRKSH
jgi:glycosyltransferase involved in cell wall biosynthesis